MTITDRMICCRKRDVAFYLELQHDLPHPVPRVGFYGQEEIGFLLLELEKSFLGMQRVRLDQNGSQIQLTEERFEHCPLVVLTSGVAGLAIRQAEGRGVERDMSNKG